jgi:hypothetical protein
LKDQIDQNSTRHECRSAAAAKNGSIGIDKRSRCRSCNQEEHDQIGAKDGTGCSPDCCGREVEEVEREGAEGDQRWAQARPKGIPDPEAINRGKATSMLSEGNDDTGETSERDRELGNRQEGVALPQDTLLAV